MLDFVKKPRISLFTPPFTQLNTPYPATAYLKGFLGTQGYETAQADLGIDVILRLFSRAGLQAVFDTLEQADMAVSDNSYRIYSLRDAYLDTIDPVIAFLQHRQPTLAHSISSRQYLPEAGRFRASDDLEWAFGSMGLHDKARHLATLYLEDLGDLVRETIDPHFGFSRYAERLGRTATHFDEMEAALHAPETRITEWLQAALAAHMAQHDPQVVCLSVPFPGNLFGAFKIGQYLRRHHPDVAVVLGGGYANTELRRLREPRVFDYLDYVCLDDGEAPLLGLLAHLEGRRPRSDLKRTYAREAGTVRYFNGAREKDVLQREVGTPDYEGLPLDRYLSVIELANPMHSLWSNGRWNKLTLAHGCYWGKCSFCDVSLDYIQRYEPVDAALLCDRIETLIARTGERGFHFVDEAAPPALMRDLALELLRRRITITWWTNIRFEKRFSPGLCRLLRASGCIAVSGGLEVASDRLLALMKKGVTVAQVARVADAFTQAGIMVHAYLMYGFPTQTAQETIDALEMVRQLFGHGVLQSAYWHRFAMTAHSPVGLDPAAYGVMRTGPDFGGFADNDLFHDDPQGADHEQFGEGLRKSLFNYMHGLGFDEPLDTWFAFGVPAPSVPGDYIAQALHTQARDLPPPHTQVVWLGPVPELELYGPRQGRARLVFHFRQEEWVLQTTAGIGGWLQHWLPRLVPGMKVSLRALQEDWETEGRESFATLWSSALWEELEQRGLVCV
ncbi:MAG: radical SAM protein [Bacteroidia bacterium]